jgi:FkbM family methyltransferase
MTNLPILNRVKRVKDLFLEKLDLIIAQIEKVLISKLDIINFKLDNFSENNTKNSQAINNLLENDAFLLQFGIDISQALEILAESIKNTQAQQILLLEKLESLQQTTDQTIASLVNSQTQLLIEKLQPLQKSKEKIIIDESYFQNIERGLMNYLYSYLPNRTALDIGANKGDISDSLLNSGYEVYAFEPFLPVFEKLANRFIDNPNFHVFSLAVGSTDEILDLYIASDLTNSNVYQDSTYYNSLIKHSLAEDLVFTSTIPVNVTSLNTLHSSSKIPTEIGLVKIDTEGYDLEVIKGMGEHRYNVVVAEFWDSKFPFGQSNSKNLLEDMVKEMKQKDYNWYVVIYRIWGSSDVSYYCNYQYSVENSWGNVFFFQDYDIFNAALKWCSAIIPPTYFAS